MVNWAESDNYISWKPPSTLPGLSESDADGMSYLTSALIPRPTAWISVYPSKSNDDEPLVALIDGYCGASDRPPTLMVGSDSIPTQILNGLRENGVCCLSVATEREIDAAKSISAELSDDGNILCGPAKTFGDANLKPCLDIPSALSSLPVPPAPKNTGTNYFRRPPAVDSSPVHMHCRLIMDVPLFSSQQTKDDDITTSKSSMLLLQIDTYVIKGTTLRTQSTLYPERTYLQGNPDVRSITAKIDCLLLRPLASLGNRTFGTVQKIYHMGRPRPIMSASKKKEREYSRSQMLINSCNPKNNGNADAAGSNGNCTSNHDIVDQHDLNEETCNNVNWESSSRWEIDDLTPAVDNSTSHHKKEGDGKTITYTYRVDNHCPLGYNPMKQVVCPRFIGWISTYEPGSLQGGNCTCKDTDNAVKKIPHISPYSFFMDIARGPRPMVAFAACPRSDEFANSDSDSDNEDDNDNTDGAYWKDAQRDAELTGVFCVNAVSEELAWAMNASAATLGKGLSEFRLMEDQRQPKTVPIPIDAPSINAPFVPQSPMFMECRYVRTVKIPDIFMGDSMYSLVVGEVINVHIIKDFLVDGNDGNLLIDLQKVRPVARLGYGQEYTVISEHL